MCRNTVTKRNSPVSCRIGGADPGNRLGQSVGASFIRHLLRVLVPFVLGMGAVAEASQGKALSHWKHGNWSAQDGAPGLVQAIAQTPDGYL